MTSSYPMYVVFYDGFCAAVLKRQDETKIGVPIYEVCEIFEEEGVAEAGRRALELTRLAVEGGAR